MCRGLHGLFFSALLCVFCPSPFTLISPRIRAAGGRNLRRAPPCLAPHRSGRVNRRNASAKPNDTKSENQNSKHPWNNSETPHLGTLDPLITPCGRAVGSARVNPLWSKRHDQRAETTTYWGPAVTAGHNFLCQGIIWSRGDRLVFWLAREVWSRERSEA